MAGGRRGGGRDGCSLGRAPPPHRDCSQPSQRGWGMGSLLLHPSRCLVPASLNENATLGTPLLPFGHRALPSPPYHHPAASAPGSGLHPLLGGLTVPDMPRTTPPTPKAFSPALTVWKANSVAPARVNTPCLAAVTAAPWFLYWPSPPHRVHTLQ